MGKTLLTEVYLKHYAPTSTSKNTPKMSFVEFLQYVSIDPTSNNSKFEFKEGELQSVICSYASDLRVFRNIISTYHKGKYLQWLLIHKDEIISDGSVADNTEAINKALFWYDYNKVYLPERDIDAMNVADLLSFYKQSSSLDFRAQHELDKAEQKGAEIVYLDPDWAIVVPHTFKASCFYGQFTKWCTTSREAPEYFDKYNDKGPLYICIDRHSSHKYQFFFVPNEYDFRNEVDDAVYPWDVTMPQGAKKYFQRVCGSKALTTDELNARLANGDAPEDIFDRVDTVSDGYQLVKIDMRYNYIDMSTNQLLSRQWYFFAKDFKDGKAKVWIQRFTHTYLGTDGMYIEDWHKDDYDTDAWDDAEYYI